MSKILLSPNAAGTGTFTIAAPNSNSDRTLTLPDSTGTVIVNSGAQTIEFADGSAGSPSVTNSGDTNTGMFFPTADTIAFAEGGVEAMRIDSSGHVGIGTTSPSGKFQVSNTNTSGTSADNLAVYFSSSNRNSNVYIQAKNTESSIVNFGDGDSLVSGRINYTHNGDYMQFDINGSERMRIDSAGNVILGSNTSTTAYNKLNLWTPASTLSGIFMEKQSQVVVQMGFKASTNTDFFIGTGSYTLGTYGVYLANTGTSWISVSDERQKDIIEPIENALTKVNALRTVIGKYKYDEEGVRRSFLIAQDVQTVFPEAVKIQNDEEALLGLSYTDVIPLLTAAVKELKAIIDTQDKRIQELEGKA